MLCWELQVFLPNWNSEHWEVRFMFLEAFPWYQVWVWISSGLLKMKSVMRVSMLLWLLLLPKWCLLFVLGTEKMALGRGNQRLPPLHQCFGECIEFLTHSGILAAHILPRMLFTGFSSGFWDCLRHSHFYACLFVFLCASWIAQWSQRLLLYCLSPWSFDWYMRTSNFLSLTHFSKLYLVMLLWK